ncbi:hypothetical protein [Ferrimonas kyonanensis]|uniref:hypothetical protein n=1 Tax=Ferrimonas kyonanensis TaxID=364763 RepID=UPI0004832CA8|nr:hypothetical protein [Ferrimonas kyonanensis]
MNTINGISQVLPHFNSAPSALVAVRLKRPAFLQVASSVAGVTATWYSCFGIENFAQHRARNGFYKIEAGQITKISEHEFEQGIALVGFSA